MGIAYQADGSVICTGDANPARTATYAGPKNAAAQLSSITAFFGQEPAPADPLPGTLDYLLTTSAAFVKASITTVVDVLTNYPAGAAYRGKYVRVSDFGGFVDRVLRCDFDSNANLYFWTPTQADYARQVAVPGDISLLALKNPNSVLLTGTIPAATVRNVTIDLSNRRPGEVIEVRNSMTSILGTLNLVGTGIGTLVFNTLGGYSRLVVDYSGGSAQLVKLQ